MQELLYVFLGLIGGAALLGLGIFFWLLLDAVKKLTKAANEIAPLCKLATVGNFSEGLTILGAAIPELVKSMGGMNQALQLFCQFAFAAPSTKSVTADVNSGFYGYNEQDAASRERVEEAVRAGVPTEAAREAVREEAVVSEV